MMILAVMMVMTISATAMSYNAAKNEALFLSDKMAYELNLTAAQYEAVYEINLDYLMMLNAWQYDKYITLAYFYRPVAWRANGWIFNVYTRYDRGHFYHAHPTVFVTYKGGNNHKAAHFYADRHVAQHTSRGGAHGGRR